MFFNIVLIWGDSKQKTKNTISLLSLQRELVVFTVIGKAICIENNRMQVQILLSPQLIPGCPCGNTNFRVTIQRENEKCLQ